MELRALPADYKLERMILSTIFMKISDVDTARDYIDTLSEDMFQNPFHKKIYNECRHSITVDKVIGIPDALANMDGADAAEFMGNHFMEFQLGKAINDLKELKLRREIITKSRDLESKAYENSFKRDDLIESFNVSANEISGFKQTEKPTTLKVISQAVKRVQEAVSGDGSERILYCHDVVDRAVSIFRKQIHSLGADQGGGKTALALDCFRRQAKAGMNVVYFCTESSADELLLRMIGAEMLVDMQSLLTGEMKECTLRRFAQAVESFKQQHDNFWIIGLGDWDCTVASANSILSRIMREAGHIEMAYWDFLQDILPPRGNKNIDIIETIRLNTSGIKQATERHNLASTVLSQFRKDKGNHKPMKQDFWGASAIINASHLMSVLYSEFEQGESAPPEKLPLLWYSVKTRLVKPWCRKLIFNGQYGSFHSAAYESRFSASDHPTKSHNRGSKDD